MKRIRIFAYSVFLGCSYHLIHCGQTLLLFTVVRILIECNQCYYSHSLYLHVDVDYVCVSICDHT